MKILVYTGELGIGGTSKAAVMWAIGLKNLGHEIHYASNYYGDYANELNKYNINVYYLPKETIFIKTLLEELKLDIIHYHSPGNENPEGFYFVSAIKQMIVRPYVIQTNVFGLFENEFEEACIDFTLFISWTSCAQSALRKKIDLHKEFFKKKSVVVYPLSINTDNYNILRNISRKKLNIADDEVVFGKIARPDMAKWNLLIIDAFYNALKSNRKIKLLLQEPPIEIIDYVNSLNLKEFVIVLNKTSTFNELKDSYLAIDVVLHITVFGESFGYGIAEAMALSKPIITNSTPWGDQAQIELVQDGYNGFIANTIYTISKKILWFTKNTQLITVMGEKSKLFINDYSDYLNSTKKLESIMKSLLTNSYNPFSNDDYIKANRIKNNLILNNFGVNIIDKYYTYLKYIYI